jgi:hypothetical protein
MIKARLVPTAAEGTPGRERASSASATDQPTSKQAAHTEEDTRSQDVVSELIIGDWSLVMGQSSLVIRQSSPVIC